MTTKTIADQIISDPCASYWLKGAVSQLFQRDPVDALRDAQDLHAAMQERLNDLQTKHYENAIKNGRTRP